MITTQYQLLIAQLISWTNVAVLVAVAVVCALAFFHCLTKTKAVLSSLMTCEWDVSGHVHTGARGQTRACRKRSWSSPRSLNSG